ncbi:MAG: hypothetical protein JWL64_2235, partial [Frankiales bacterium]|nr:hypothetical protein [Frankiales bacterium]
MSVRAVVPLRTGVPGALEQASGLFAG